MEESGEKRDLLIRDLWKNGTDIIHNMCVLNTDTSSYLQKDPMKVLHGVDMGGKQKYLEACHLQRCHFLPFLCSVDGLL